MILKTPNHEVVLRDFITGRQREYIDSSQFDAIKTKASYNDQGKMVVDFGDVDTTKLIETEKHRKIECYVEKIDGEVFADSKKLLETVLNLPEDDYLAVLAGIEEVVKKKRLAEPTLPSSVKP